jgi:uncharacterized membrane protein YgcG
MLSLALISLLTAVPPAPKQRVTDDAELLRPAVRSRLDRRLESLEHATGYQVLIWVGPSAGGEPLEQFGANTFASWRNARPRLDNGAILFIFTQDQTLRLEVGRGLQSVLTPEDSKRMLDEGIAPFLEAGEPEVALSGAVDAITTQLTGAAIPATPVKDRISLQQGFVIALALVGFFMVLFIARPESVKWFVSLRFLRRRGGPLSSH